MFFCVNGNFHSPVECMLVILSDKKRSVCDEKIVSVSHPGAVEWPVSQALLFLFLPTSSLSFSCSESNTTCQKSAVWTDMR